jgi:hypothetical protein
MFHQAIRLQIPEDRNIYIHFIHDLSEDMTLEWRANYLDGIYTRMREIYTG